MSTHLKPAFLMLVVLTLLTGIIYPLTVAGLAQALFPGKADGSLLTDSGGKSVGSELIGQLFGDPRYFWGRPSATAPYPYNASASGGSNQGPTNPALADAVKARIQALRNADPENRAPVPIDLVTASASGLDPHISPAAAEYQINRIAKVRKLDPKKVGDLIAENTEGRQFGILGEPRVNVLKLNLALNRWSPK
jgi:K+-transporting ATPase ATPase C chain